MSASSWPRPEAADRYVSSHNCRPRLGGDLYQRLWNVGPAGTTAAIEKRNEAKHRQNPHHPRRQPAASPRSARCRAGEGGGKGGRREGARAAVAEIVRTQIDLGIDIIDDGEFGKPSFVSYVNERLGGFEVDKDMPRQSPWAGSREARSFPEFYGQGHVAARQNHMVCTAPIAYRGTAQLQTDIDNLKAALNGVKAEEVFMPAISPASVADWQRNAYYKTEEEYLFAIADALREEYEAIVNAGVLLQVDDPHLVTYWIKEPDLTLEQFRKWAQLRVEALNHAL